MDYRIINVYTSEDARSHGRPVWEAVVEQVRKARCAARCIVLKGVAGLYESGEQASSRLEVLSYNMPVKVEIILPAGECEALVERLSATVTDGIVVSGPCEVVFHRVSNGLTPRRLKVRDVMTANPTAVLEATPVSDIIRLLITADFNAVPVVDEAGRPKGIVTQGDLIERAGMPVRLGLLAELEQAQLDGYLANVTHLSAADVMTSPVVTVQADTPLPQAVAIMLRRNLKRFPVVDARDRLVGMLARLDIFGTMASQSVGRRTMGTCSADAGAPTLVRDIMSRERNTVEPNATGAEVLDRLRSSGVQRLAVVDEQGKFLGLITDYDLFAALTERRGGFWEYLKRRGDMDAAARRKTAAEIMKTNLVTVCENTPIEEAVNLMTEHGLKRLPVLSENGSFEGMITRQAALAAGSVCDEPLASP